MNINQEEAWFFVKFVTVVGIYCRKTENQERVCIVKIFGVHDPRLRHIVREMSRKSIFQIWQIPYISCSSEESATSRKIRGTPLNVGNFKL